MDFTILTWPDSWEDETETLNSWWACKKKKKRGVPEGGWGQEWSKTDKKGGGRKEVRESERERERCERLASTRLASHSLTKPWGVEVWMGNKKCFVVTKRGQDFAFRRQGSLRKRREEAGEAGGAAPGLHFVINWWEWMKLWGDGESQKFSCGVHRGHLRMESPAPAADKQTVAVHLRQRGGRGEGVHPAAEEQDLCHPPVQRHEVKLSLESLGLRGNFNFINCCWGSPSPWASSSSLPQSVHMVLWWSAEEFYF